MVLAGSYGSPGPLRLDTSRYLIEPLRALQDWETSQVTILKATQTAGTLTAELFLQWALVNRPVPILWICQSDDMAEVEMNTRIKPSLLSNVAIQPYLPTDVRKIRSDGVDLPNLNFTICGPSLNNLQSSTRGIVILDEFAFYDAGNVLIEASNRTNYFAQYGMSKIVIVSQAGSPEGELDETFRTSTMEEWNVPCTYCDKHFVPDITHFNASGKPWNTVPDIKDDSGNYNLGLLESLLTLECPYCKGLMRDTPQLKQHWNMHGKFVATNPTPIKGHRGFRWNAIHCTPWIRFVADFLAATLAKKKGDTEPFIRFFQKRLARSINPHEYFAKNKVVRTDIKYDKSGWSDEYIRIMTIDVQEHHFVAVIRAWSKDGRSRLLWTGRLMMIQDVLEKQKEYNIPFFESNGRKTYMVCWDTGYPVRIREIYNYIIRYDHIGFKGEVARKGYIDTKIDKRTGKKIELYRVFRKSVTGGDPNVGTPLQGKGPKVELYLLATDTLKKILTQLRDGKGSEWLCLPLTDPFMDEYNRSMFSEYADPVEKNGKRYLQWKKISSEACNDYWDAECMNLAAAIMADVQITELKEMPTNDYIEASTNKQSSNT